MAGWRSALHKLGQGLWARFVHGRSLTIALLVLSLLIVLNTAREPGMRALACPGCFGFERAAPGLFVERAMGEAARAELVRAKAWAGARVAGFYGSRESRPRVLACASEACYQRLGGRFSVGASWGSFGIRLSPRGLNRVVMAHEMAHSELAHRVGLSKAITHQVPVWFNEGLAVVISGDPAFLGGTQDRPRCLIPPLAQMPETPRDWIIIARGDPALYAKAGCAVLVWLDRAGPEGLPLLIDRMARGDGFQAADQAVLAQAAGDDATDQSERRRGESP